MSWCRQEAIRQRRALMYPTSMTRNGANDFDGGENDLMIQGLGLRSWKNEAWRYCSRWDTSWVGEFSDWLLLNISVTLKWIGSINPKYWWYDGPMVIWPVNEITQPDSIMVMEWKCHVQERLATNKVSSSFIPNFPQSLLTSTSLFLSRLRGITYACFIIFPSGKTVAMLWRA